MNALPRRNSLSQVVNTPLNGGNSSVSEAMLQAMPASFLDLGPNCGLPERLQNVSTLAQHSEVSC